MKEILDTQEVWKEFSGQIRGYLLGKVKQRDDAEDLLQEIFIKIHNNISTLQDVKKLAPWIHQIVRNTLTDYYRKHNLETTELHEESAVDDTETDDLYSACISGCLKVFIDRLPDKYREPLVLSDIDELKQKDIAKQMNLSYSGLKSRVQRGREMIKDMFVECSCYVHDANGTVVADQFDPENCEICNPKPK